MSEPRIDVLSDIACHLGEGPTYDPQSGTLFWFDILGRKLWSRSDAGEVSVADLPEMTSALGIVDAGRQLLVTETGVHVRDVATGRITLHTPLEADNVGTRSNDSRVHPSGAFWIGTTRLKGRTWFRACMVNLRTTEAHVDRLIALLERECAAAEASAAR